MSDEKANSYEVEMPPESAARAHEEGPPASQETIDRRRFLARGSIAVGVGCGVALTAPIVGFVVSPLFQKTSGDWELIKDMENESEYLALASIKIGETIQVRFQDSSPRKWAGVTANSAAWVRRVADRELIAFSVNCAHLGCPVRWIATANLFMCPCHGGVYYADGTVAAGPPPHPLWRYPVRASGPYIEIQTQPIPIG